jgi:hypothetical protein
MRPWRLLLQAQFVQLANEVKAGMRAGFWKMSLLEPAASGAVAALEASMSLAMEAVAGCIDGWAAPEDASARLAAQHFTQVLRDRCWTALSMNHCNAIRSACCLSS